jgi:Fur family ferric uptake transcriptional regulator
LDGIRTEGSTDNWAVDLLRRYGLRATSQRLAIVAALQRLGHATIEQLLEASQEVLPTVQPSTVYRSLETLAEHGLVSHTHLLGTSKTYQLSTHANHAHLVCRGCGSVTELADDIARGFTADISHRHGFDVDFGHLSVFGRCADCVAADLDEGQH